MALMTYATLYTDLAKLRINTEKNIKIIDKNLVEHLSKKDMNDDYIKYLSSMKDLDNDLLKYLLSNNIYDGDMINYIDKYLTNLKDINQKILRSNQNCLQNLVKEIDPKLATFIETSSDSFIVSELVNKLKSESDKDSNNDSIKDKKKPLKKPIKKASVKKNSDDSK